MKKTKLSSLPFPLSDTLVEWIGKAEIFDSSSSPEARVLFIARDGGYYLKRAPGGTLSREATMTRHFHALGLGAEVLCYTTEKEYDLLLTAALPGEDATHASFLAHPARLCERMAEELYRLHSLSIDGCPVPNRTAEYIRNVEARYAQGVFDPSYSSYATFRTADEAIACFRAHAQLLHRDTLIHGDYCLPNLLLFPDFSLSGFIDVGCAGVGDRHVDLFWGAWTLAYNLGTDAYRDRFFDAYGRDRIDPEMLRAIAAAECFG